MSKSFPFKKALYDANIANNNSPDITKFKGSDLDKLKIDVFSYSFPCQGLSIANMGRAKGIMDKSSTSNLIWEIKRILDEATRLPKYLLMENVPALLDKNHKKHYLHWTRYLKSLGYKTATLILNGLDFGSIQNRDRVFAISIQKSVFKNLNWNNTTFKAMVSKYEKKLSSKKRKEKYMDIFDF